MSNIFGIVSQNMITVQQVLQKHAKNMQIIDTLQKPLNTRRIKRADLLLVGNIKTYNSIIPTLNKGKQVVIIFDSPLALQHQEEIKIIDYTGTDILNSNFQIVYPDYAEVIKALRAPEMNKLVRNKVDFLSELIKKNSAGGFLDKFNTYIYQATTPRSKPQVRNDIVQFVFGKINADVLIASVIKHGAKNGAESMQLLQQIIDYMNGNPGEMLRLALKKAVEMENAASITARRTIPYKKITDEFHVDKFELRNLLLLYRNKV